MQYVYFRNEKLEMIAASTLDWALEQNLNELILEDNVELEYKVETDQNDLGYVTVYYTFTELKTTLDYDANEYARLRKVEYNKLNQDEMRFDDRLNGTDFWYEAILAIKTAIPKP